MKLLIASDIHGSAYFCAGLLERIKLEQPDRVVLLGDILYHGPRNELPRDYAPKKVIEQLNAIGDTLLTVRGNCDTEVDQMVLSFPIMAEYAAIFADGFMMYCVHGHKLGSGGDIPVSAGDIVLSGHTHIPLCEERDGVLYLNPGSVSIPKNGSPNSYMTYENGKFLWKDLSGEVYLSCER